MKSIQIIKGNIVFTPTAEEFVACPKGYIILEDGIVQGIYRSIPQKYKDLPVQDYGEQLIVPGLMDLHVHASQFDQVGLGLDVELIDWLNQYTFHLESKFLDLSYAKKVYSRFVEELLRQGTTRASIFATIHKESTALLFDSMIQKGIGGFVGKVNMDRNGTENLQEDMEQSIIDTEELIQRYKDHPLVKPILTPRFAPTCSGELLKRLGRLAEHYQIPVQSHLSENREEVQWVAELFPHCRNYSQVYDTYGLFGTTPTLMAHGIYLEEEELQRIINNGVMLVHCPDSNMNLGSGMMPARRWLNKGISIGLGSDVGGGHRLSMTETMTRAIQTSKILFSITGEKPLTLSEVFFMATKGGGSFFGKVGSFEPGYEFDALVIQDEPWVIQRLTLEERVQRWIYTGDDRNIAERYIKGNRMNQQIK